MTIVPAVSSKQQNHLEQVAASIARCQAKRDAAGVPPERKVTLNIEITTLVQKQCKVLGLNPHATEAMIKAYTQDNVS